MSLSITLDGNSLTFKQVLEYLENKSMQVQISDGTRQKVSSAREQIKKWLLADKKVVYGLTTGLGKLKDYVIDEEDQWIFQRNILYSHAVGLGPYFDQDIVRLAMLFRLNVLCRGNSGVRLELIDRILLFLNQGIVPLIPQIGSLGVGDLQPMAHLGLCLAGYPEGQVWYQSQSGSAPEVLKGAGISPVEFPLATGEALSLMSGSTVLLAAAVYSYYKAAKLVLIADAAVALNLEAMRGEIEAFDSRIHAARGFQEQMDTSQNIWEMVDGSCWMSDEGRQRLGETRPRVQDAVSFRASGQIHGSVRDVLNYIETVLAREMNASTDNPLLFLGTEEYESLSGGNFHGALLAYCMDFLAIILTDLAVVSERRSARLLDPMMSYGLPSNLVGGTVGLNTGFALVQANATALIGEMRILSTPASIGSIPSKGNQEDHNSMGMGAARKAMLIIEHLKSVLAVELLCAAQGIDLIKDRMAGLPMGNGTSKIYELIRQHVAPMLEDRYIRQDLYKVIELIENGELLCCAKKCANHSSCKC